MKGIMLGPNQLCQIITLIFHAYKPPKKKDGEKKEYVQWSKVTENWVAVKKKEKKSRGFIDEIFKEFKNVAEGKTEKNDKIEVIPKNIAKTPKPSKEEVVSRKRSRFQLESPNIDVPNIPMPLKERVSATSQHPDLENPKSIKKTHKVTRKSSRTTRKR